MANLFDIRDNIDKTSFLVTLESLGFEYLSFQEALHLKDSKSSSVLLEGVLRKQLRKVNGFLLNEVGGLGFVHHSTEAGIKSLKNLPIDRGFLVASQRVHLLLTEGLKLGVGVRENTDHFILKYIDWVDINNNVFHATDGNVDPTLNNQYTCSSNVILFVNGIPIALVEFNSSDSVSLEDLMELENPKNIYTRKNSVLGIYIQLIFKLVDSSLGYMSSDLSNTSYFPWLRNIDVEEESLVYRKKIQNLKSKLEKQKNLVDVAKSEKMINYLPYLKTIDERILTKRELVMSNLLSPKRILEFIEGFVTYDSTKKKVARYHQYDTVKRILKRVYGSQHSKTRGGFIMHTQGTGKTDIIGISSLFISRRWEDNAKIVLVYNHDDILTHVCSRLENSKIFIENVVTGKRLVNLLKNEGRILVAVTGKKFEAALHRLDAPYRNQHMVVFVDDLYDRSSRCFFKEYLKEKFPETSFVVMSGMPLLRRDKRMILSQLGSDLGAYTVARAINDRVLVPTLYECRKKVYQSELDSIHKFSDLVSKIVPEHAARVTEKIILKGDSLSKKDKEIFIICCDISRHFQDNIRDSQAFKGLLVCRSKKEALKCKSYIDMIAMISCEVMLPRQATNEEETLGNDIEEDVTNFWKGVIDTYSTINRYEESVSSRFSTQNNLEMLVTVSEMVTKFFEPKNKVIYTLAKMQGSTFLQACARVSKSFPGKDYGLIIDYHGLSKVANLEIPWSDVCPGYDKEDVEDRLQPIRKEIDKIKDRHQRLWAVFKVANRIHSSQEQCLSILRYKEKRQEFYNKFLAFFKVIKISCSSIDFLSVVGSSSVDEYRKDMEFFLKLRHQVSSRYAHSLEYARYEEQIQNFLNIHLQSSLSTSIPPIVNVFDKDHFLKEVSQSKSIQEKADKIAFHLELHLKKQLSKDIDFYKPLLYRLRDSINDYQNATINEKKYLKEVNGIMEIVIFETYHDIPEDLIGQDATFAFYSAYKNFISTQVSIDLLDSESIKEVSLGIEKIVKSLVEDEWKKKIDISKQMILRIGDYVIDEIKTRYSSLGILYDDIDVFSKKCVEIATQMY